MNYYNPYQNNMYNPYMQQQRMPQMEQAYQPQYSQQPAQPMLTGRVVDDISTVNASEIPMDGTLAIFPKKDLSEIYIRTWQNDGTIKTISYKPQIDNLIQEPNKLSQEQEKLKFAISENVTTLFENGFKELNDKIDKLDKKMIANRAKKEE